MSAATAATAAARFGLIGFPPGLVRSAGSEEAKFRGPAWIYYWKARLPSDKLNKTRQVASDG